MDGDNAIDAPTWYADTDGDGFGDPAAVTVSCVAPAGAVATADDCDDGDAATYPGATETRDWGDQDCNGQDEVGLDRADAIVHGNAGDYAGGLNILMDMDEDGLDEWFVNAAQSNSNPGKVCVFQDPIGVEQNIYDADFCFYGISRNDRFGNVRNVGDTNGDGVPDLGIGAYWADPNGSNSGGA